MFTQEKGTQNGPFLFFTTILGSVALVFFKILFCGGGIVTLNPLIKCQHSFSQVLTLYLLLLLLFDIK